MVKAIIFRFYDVDTDEDTIHDELCDWLDTHGWASFNIEIEGVVYRHVHKKEIDEDGSNMMPEKMAEDILEIVGATTEDLDRFLETGECLDDKKDFMDAYI